jgi:1-deoxy-D-xylulose-5-phosphate synthase
MLLSNINQPSDLRQLQPEQLEQIATELRQFIISTLNQCGGHFAANLGTIELTIALHYVFNTPTDRLIWDVGHQAYPHKVLTGRRDTLHTIRQSNGLAPFPSRDESEFDTFTTGHSSTSISAALGMAIADQMEKNPRKIVAIIGDGGMTAGMAFEALNQAGSLNKDLLVILNDNDMSISPNVGGLNNYLARVLSSHFYSTLREGSKKVLEKMPPVLELAKRTVTHMKGMVIAPGTFFEELGFNYIGPIDGHDLPTLIKTLQNMHELKGPQFLHVRTIKGKGYAPAEADPVKYHAVKPGFYDADQSNEKPIAKPSKPTYSDIFGEWLCDMAAADSKLIAITPAMCEGSGMVQFAKNFPDRYYDVGIAEQHSVTLAAGMACEGKKPVVAIYSTFLQRAYDQLIHDVCLPNLDVTFALDRAGVVGGDGPTHHGNFDLSYLRCIPNIIVMAPTDENECRQMLFTAYQFPGPAAVRYPRGSGPNIPTNKIMQELTIGKAEIRRQGKEIAILAFGSMLQPALTAGNELNATVVNMRFIKPLDNELIKQLAQNNKMLVTVEENVIAGGAGSAVNELLAKENLHCAILNLGLPDNFIAHGDPNKLLTIYGLDAAGIIKAILNEESQV